MQSRTSSVQAQWAGPESDICAVANRLSSEVLDAYKVHPSLVREHANIERAITQGGYGHRQLYELIQNGADALIGSTHGQITVVLTENALYCANEGNPIDADGVEALLHSHVSAKRGNEIGRFGLGFKSVLVITNHPEFYSRSGSFEFDAMRTRRKIQAVASGFERCPVLRLAYPVNPSEKAAADPVLEELLSWAATVVKLPGGTIVTPSLARDIVEFPSEFLIFSPHVSRLEFQDRVSGISRDIELRKDGHLLELTEAGRLSQWRLFENALRPSPAARQDAGELADRGSIPVMWAVQTRGRREDGSFWAFFPTEYRTTLSGIVNAPWKTNEDRQNLLRGPFNEELIDSASALIARSIPEVFDPDDPGRHLDLMPARASDARNWADVRLMSGVYDQLVRHVSLPDQEGELRLPAELHLHPQGIPPASLERWSQSRHRPVDWVHPATNTRERRPRVERLMGEERAAATMTRWLEAILDGDDLADRSRDAVAVAASLVGRVPRALIRDVRSAAIVLTSDGRLLSPDSAELFLPGLHDLTVGVALVDHRLADDAATCAALEDLGVQRVDTARELEALVSRNLGDWSDRDWEQFWLLAREVPVTQSAPMIRKRRSRKARRPVDHDRTFSAAAAEIRVRTLDGRYRPINRVLLPGRIVPPDGGHDAALAVDIDFHEGDLELIRALGGTDCPEVWDQAESEAWFREFQSSEARKYEESLDPGHSIPREGYLAFESVTTIGPLAPLSELTEEGRANFTRDPPKIAAKSCQKRQQMPLCDWDNGV